MAEQTLTCADCQKTFAFTEQEQAFFQERGFAPPKRCPECRKARRATRDQGGPPRPQRRAGPPGGGPPPRFGGRGHGPGEGGGGHAFRPSRPPGDRFRIVCDGCGQEASVPFEPAPGRPVYCQVCYRDRKGS